MKHFEIKNGIIHIAEGVTSECADYIVDKFDDFYNAGKLDELWVGTVETNNTRIIEPVWNKSYKYPTTEEFEELLESWYGEWQQKVCVDLAVEQCQ